MRMEDVALESGLGGLAVPRQAAQPEEERVPVDERDHFERDQGILEREPE